MTAVLAIAVNVSCVLLTANVIPVGQPMPSAVIPKPRLLLVPLAMLALK